MEQATGDRRAHRLGQAAGRAGSLKPSLKGASDGAGEGLLSIAAQQARQGALIQALDEPLSALREAWIHTHIHRAIRGEGEASGGGVKLVGGDPQISQEPIHLPKTLRLQQGL